MSNLKEHPDVQELIDTLDKNGLEKEKAEVVSLADYIVDMEKTLSGMLVEMQAMRNEVNLIHNSTLRAKCSRLVDKAENSIKQAFGVIRSVKLPKSLTLLRIPEEFGIRQRSNIFCITKNMLAIAFCKRRIHHRFFHFEISLIAVKWTNITYRIPMSRLLVENFMTRFKEN